MRPQKVPIAKFLNILLFSMQSNFIIFSKNFALFVLQWRNKTKNENSFFDTYFNIFIQHTHISFQMFRTTATGWQPNYS